MGAKCPVQGRQWALDTQQVLAEHNTVAHAADSRREAQLLRGDSLGPSSSFLLHT